MQEPSDPPPTVLKTLRLLAFHIFDKLDDLMTKLYSAYKNQRKLPFVLWLPSSWLGSAPV
jgi:hypothetical protein